MSLPKDSTPSPKSTFLKRQKLESWLLPGMIVFILLAILAAAVLIPKTSQEKKQSDRDIAVYTASNKVKIHGGKTIEVEAIVKQIPPETLYSEIRLKENVGIIHVFEDGQEINQPHIAGSQFIPLSEFDHALILDPEKNYVYVSSDGYASAKAISKVIKYGFSREKHMNLEGGLKAWKEKGFDLDI